MKTMAVYKEMVQPYFEASKGWYSDQQQVEIEERARSMKIEEVCALLRQNQFESADSEY